MAKLFHYLIFSTIVAVAFIRRCETAKSKKFKFPDEKKVVQYNGAVLFHYGNDTCSDRFYANLEPLGYEKIERLSKCSIPNSKDCVSDLNERLAGVKTQHALILVNSDHGFVNAAARKTIRVLKNSKSSIVVPTSIMRVGPQFVADRNTLKDILEDNLRQGQTHLESILKASSKVSEDTSGAVFALLDDVGIEDINGANEYNNRILIVGHFGASIIISQNINDTSRLDHISNLYANFVQLKPVLQEKSLPIVMLAITVEDKSLFLEEFFEKILALDYPNDKTLVEVIVQDEDKVDFVKDALKSRASEYKSSEVTAEKVVYKGRRRLMSTFKESEAAFIFFVSTSAHLEEPAVLSTLVSQDLSFSGPYLKTYEHFHSVEFNCDYGWNTSLDHTSTFHYLATQRLEEWEAAAIKVGVNFLLPDTLVRRGLSIDSSLSFWAPYLDVLGEEQNLEHPFKLQEYREAALTPISMNVGQRSVSESIAEKDRCCRTIVESLRDCYLVKKDIFDHYQNVEDLVPQFTSNHAMDDALCKVARSHGNVLYVVHDRLHGQLVNLQDYPESKVEPEVFRMLENHKLWERRYIRQDITDTTHRPPEAPVATKAIEDTVKNNVGCEDVSEINLFTERFVNALVAEAERANKWRPHRDGGPLVVSLLDLGLEATWVGISNYYVHPRKCHMFEGMISFKEFEAAERQEIIKYESSATVKQYIDFSEVHSLYQMRMALNSAKDDFEGGGIKFVKDQCYLEGSSERLGTLQFMPGHITHNYVKYAPSKGTSYVLEVVSATGDFSFESMGGFIVPGFLNEDPKHFRELTPKVRSMCDLFSLSCKWSEEESRLIVAPNI